MINSVYLIQLLRQQRNTFERLIDGTKRIFNPISYKFFEDELFNVQEKIGRENKKKISEELVERGINPKEYFKNNPEVI